ncbi:MULTISPECIES: helix-turn-helix domain-containing protein [unclassified Avibacterium]|uniref:helix-turn-helix domain-containing protein n=1 Tax=unclassified Avibacterium TaxID=2685287 RepID=UPI002025E9B9|nr:MULTISPECIES: helix-turn-helix domain-containing protein [unclassified Avibacterium]MCW9698023.1 helix-turn-helix domain-containing protein [Avibacterium sp. 20-129]MCW9733858.1 helix-turn-helix domain-containing protein [Avibacterium sp. 20-15]URL03983.1 helix-turn-helix domain-containing protein [Avibacterium sp. 20-132]URL05653.1 helix-turn-helix domain-containing protein [Avibacterium sp. 21-595]
MERNLFEELKQGLEQMQVHLEGKTTLKTIERELPAEMGEISANEVKSIREKLNLSQSVFAKKLRMSVRTYQGWEQGKTTPNKQATLLLKMIERSPQTFEDIASL